MKKEYESKAIENKNKRKRNMESTKHIYAAAVKNDGERRKRKTCSTCYNISKKRVYTTNFCATCPKKPAFCSEEHFHVFHAKNLN